MEDLEMKNFWQDRRVFVTGASGLVGGWLVEKLIRQGADVIALVRDWVPCSNLLSRDIINLVPCFPASCSCSCSCSCFATTTTTTTTTTGREAGHIKVTIVRGDLSDSRFLERVIAEYEIESVIHLAAQTIVPIANKNPLSTFESNVAGTWNLLEACRHVKSLASVVVASSDKAYGDAPELPLCALLPCFPASLEAGKQGSSPKG